ncbi:MAG: hypothetical protein R2706_10420 [Acidimicrobiales bacterium]
MPSTTSTIRLASAFSGTPAFPLGDTNAIQAATPLPREADVVIVGAGFAAIGAAIELAVRQHSVVVLTAGELGDDPLIKGLGELTDTLPSSASLPEDGTEAAKLTTGAAEAFKWTARVINEFGIDCGYDPSASSNYINPAALYSGLLSVAAKQGAEVRAETRVLAAARANGGGFELKTTAGRIRTSQLIVADSAALASLVRKAPVTTRPTTMTYLLTEPVPGATHVSPMDGLRVFPDRRLLASAAIGGSVSDARDELGARLLGGQPALQSASSDGRELKITNAWQATLVTTSNGIPQAGEHGGVYFIVPGSTSDLARMAWLGSRTARWMTGEQEPVFGVAPARPRLAALVGAVRSKRRS